MPLNDERMRDIKGIHRLLFRLYQLVGRLVSFSGFSGVNALAGLATFIFCRFVPARCELAVDSITRHLKSGREEAERIARQSIRSNFQSFLEIFLARQFKLYDNPHLEELPERFMRLMREKRPIVPVVGHLGAWELNAGLLSQFRPGYPSVVVVRNQKAKALNAFIHELRSVGDTRCIGHRNAAAEVNKVLRAGGTAAFLVDHNTGRKEAVFLPFLDEVAAVNLGPALLALRGKALVYPVFLLRKPDQRYQLVDLPELDTETLSGSINERAVKIAEFYTAAMETFIRQYPEQWFWIHKRWKTRPEAEERPMSTTQA